MSDTEGIILTDPKPLPKDGSCPKCRAAEKQQITIATFGREPYQACGLCGHEFKE